MQVALDTHDETTVYADLREEESLSHELRARAIARAQVLGAQHVEFWRPPYGRGADRMEGFVELARVPPAPNAESDARGAADEHAEWTGPGSGSPVPPGPEPAEHRDAPFVTAPALGSVEQL